MQTSWFFVRNFGILMANLGINIKEISKNLKDLGLLIKKSIKTDLHNNYFFIVRYQSEWNDESLIELKRNQLEFDEKQEIKKRRFMGSTAIDLINQIIRVIDNVEILLCENVDFEYRNSNRIVIKLDETFTEEEINRLRNYVVLKNYEPTTTNSPLKYKTATPIVAKTNNEEFIVGFIYSAINIVNVLNLDKKVLEDRTVFGKLLMHFCNFEVDLREKIADKEDNIEEICMNFSERKYTKLLSKFPKLDKTYNFEKSILTMGSDFEFTFIDYEGRVVDADSILKDYYEVDSCTELLTYRIGVDGNTRVGECRSKVFDVSEEGFLAFKEDINNLMEEVQEIADYNGLNISFSSSLVTGFHLHTGIDMDEELSEEDKEFIGKHFSKLLDVVLTAKLVSLNTLERFMSDYSNYGYSRIKHHGFEYKSIPSTILYENLYEKVLKIYYKLALNYFKKAYIKVEMENDDVSKKFYRKLLGKEVGEYFKTINELRETINKWIVFARKMDKVNVKKLMHRRWNFCNIRDDFTEEFIIFAEDLNTQYVKNCIVFFYGLREDRGENLCTIDNYDEIFESEFYKDSNLLDGYAILKVGISRNLRINCHGNSSKEIKERMSEIIYKILEKLEKEKKLTDKKDRIFEKLCEKFSFLVPLKMAAVI